ncbi:hypothetical protein OAF63_03780 [Saprospiraceae bacterium]|nr:hypothetical protein [Saprospiraceae bacterium]
MSTKRYQSSNLRTEIIGRVEKTRSEEDMMGKDIEGYWIRNKDWFFNWDMTSGVKLLFDMNKDPLNSENLAERELELVADFSRKVEDWKAEKAKKGLND